tara:strand:- start:2047 stop:2235 length:189 start_codon:yes stop_codon:yes gene_type:complete
LPKVGGLTIRKWQSKAERAERKLIELRRQIQFRDAALKEAARKIKDLRKVNREFVKAQRDMR